MDIAASARRHDVSDDDMIYVVMNSIGVVTVVGRAAATIDMHVGFSVTGRGPFEVGIVEDEDGTAVIVHAMRARKWVLELLDP